MYMAVSPLAVFCMNSPQLFSTLLLQIEENDSVRYHAHSRGGAALQPHPFSRSLSEEAHLAGMMMGGGGGGGGVAGGSRMGGGYDSRLDEEGVQFSQDLPG